MLQIVGALILLIAGFAILRLLFRALTSTASALALSIKAVNRRGKVPKVGLRR